MVPLSSWRTGSYTGIVLPQRWLWFCTGFYAGPGRDPLVFPGKESDLLKEFDVFWAERHSGANVHLHAFRVLVGC